MDASYNYLKNIADNDTSIFGSFYRFSLDISNCFMKNTYIESMNIYTSFISYLYSISIIITISIYYLAGDNTFDDYIDDIEFLVFHIGMLLSNIIVFFIKEKNYSFMYYTMFKLLGYLSQYYVIFVVDITIDVQSSFFDLLKNIVNTINYMFRYIYTSDAKSNEFWFMLLIVSILIFFIIFITTGNPLSYLVVFMIFITIIIGLMVVSLLMLIIPIAYIISFIICMYVWHLIYVYHYIQFMYNLVIYFYNKTMTKNINDSDILLTNI